MLPPPSASGRSALFDESSHSYSASQNIGPIGPIPVVIATQPSLDAIHPKQVLVPEMFPGPPAEFSSQAVSCMPADAYSRDWQPVQHQEPWSLHPGHHQDSNPGHYQDNRSV